MLFKAKTSNWEKLLKQMRNNTRPGKKNWWAKIKNWLIKTNNLKGKSNSGSPVFNMLIPSSPTFPSGLHSSPTKSTWQSAFVILKTWKSHSSTKNFPTHACKSPSSLNLMTKDSQNFKKPTPPSKKITKSHRKKLKPLTENTLN